LLFEPYGLLSLPKHFIKIFCWFPLNVNQCIMSVYVWKVTLEYLCFMFVHLVFILTILSLYYYVKVWLACTLQHYLSNHLNNFETCFARLKNFIFVLVILLLK